MSLKENNYFTPGKSSIGGNWIKKGNLQLRYITQKGKMCPLHDIKMKKDWFVLNEWRYFQLKHFVMALPHPLRGAEDLTPLERLCDTGTAKGGISQIYKILVEGRELEVPKFIKKMGGRNRSKGRESRFRKNFETGTRILC